MFLNRYLTNREVTLLAPLEPMPPDAFTGAALLELLDSPPFKNGPPGDPDAMEQIILNAPRVPGKANRWLARPKGSMSGDHESH